MFVRVVLLASVGEYGCASEARPSYGTVRRDSAGIEIVESGAPKWGKDDGWRVSAEPSLSIGTIVGDSAYQIVRVTGAARLFDGRVAALNAGSRQILLFDRAGNLVRSIGRGGRGPGEFSSPEHLQRTQGDTLVVWDAHFGPITSFDTVGSVIAREQIDLGRLMEALGSGKVSEALTPLPDRSFIAHTTVRSQQGWVSGTIVRPPLGFLRVGKDYSADSLGWYDGIPFVPRERGMFSFPFIPLFAPSAQIAVGGSPLRIYVTNGDAFEVHAFNAKGQLVQIIRRTTPLVRIPRRELAAAKERRRKQATSGAGRTHLARMLATVPDPSHYPGISSMVVDSEGNLWTWNAGEGWSIFDNTGRWLGVLKVPLWRVYEIGDDYILGVSRDSLDVEYVEEYTLSRTADTDPTKLDG